MRFYTKRYNGTGSPVSLSAILTDSALPSSGPRKLSFIIPASHSVTIQQVGTTGWNITGDNITIDNGGGGTSLLYSFDVYTADEGQPNVTGNYPSWKQLFLTVPNSQFIYILASY
jgi:hypothetical protein